MDEVAKETAMGDSCFRGDLLQASGSVWEDLEVMFMCTHT